MKCKQKRWPSITLGPLVDFLERIHPEGINEAIVASEIGMSANSLSSMFMKDNARLSKVENIARKYGYELHLKYEYSIPYKREESFVQYVFPNSGNLYGVVEYCNKMNRTLNAVANTVGCKRDTIKLALERGDIMLDILYRILFGVGLRVEWCFEKV